MARVIGKVIGGALGFIVGGGPLGALFGMVVGHAYDTRPEFHVGSLWDQMKNVSAPAFDERARMVLYNTNVVVLSAKLAKIDGRVKREEIEAFKKAFCIRPEQETIVGNLFDSSHRRGDSFEPYAFQLAQAFVTQSFILEQVLGHLFSIAVADGAQLAASEVRYLRGVAYIFNITPDNFRRIASKSGAIFPDDERQREQGRDKESDPLTVLGLTGNATNDDIKAAYRKLIRKNHPDLLASTGKSADFIAKANEKMKKLNVAYDTLCKMRGIK